LSLGSNVRSSLSNKSIGISANIQSLSSISSAFTSFPILLCTEPSSSFSSEPTLIYSKLSLDKRNTDDVGIGVQDLGKIQQVRGPPISQPHRSIAPTSYLAWLHQMYPNTKQAHANGIHHTLWYPVFVHVHSHQ
jgi:hypothetical protein